MSRWSRYDTDEERLPEGMQRIGYDADDQTYTFRDADGSIWESAPGCQYGQLTRISDAPNYDDDDDNDNVQDTQPFLIAEQQPPALSWRSEMRPFLNFAMLIVLFLVGLFYFLHWHARHEDEMEPAPECLEGTVGYVIAKGDTCWEIAKGREISLDDLLKSNEGLNCDDLKIGSQICMPTS